MPQSDSIAELTKALAKAQAEFTVVPKTKTGREGNREFKYADLADVMGMALPKLNKQGIFLSQPLVLDKNGEHIRQTTRLQLGDEFIQSDGIRLKDPSGAGKNLGIEVTYARRIDLNGSLGISPDEDLDAPDLKSDSSSPSGPSNLNRTATGRTASSYTSPTPIAIKTTPVPSPTTSVVVSKSTSFEYGANTNQANPEITDDDLPNFDQPIDIPERLSADAQEVADHLATFVPLGEKRNTEIQNRLKELVANKTVGRRELSLFLEEQHEGKKQFDVGAKQWETTIAKIEASVSDGTIKALLKKKG